MTYRILQYPADAALLRREARDVRPGEFNGEALLAFAARLGTTMMHARGMGLAATQVQEQPGVDAAWRLFAMRSGPQSYAVLCNPHIDACGPHTPGPEGCLSFASVPETLYAPASLTLSFTTTEGERRTVGFTDMHARAVFHEVEHLSGGLIIDRLSSLKRKLFMKQVDRARRNPEVRIAGRILSEEQRAAVEALAKGYGV